MCFVIQLAFASTIGFWEWEPWAMARPAMAEQRRNDLMVSRKRENELTEKTVKEGDAEIQCDKTRCNAKGGATDMLFFLECQWEDVEWRSGHHSYGVLLPYSTEPQ